MTINDLIEKWVNRDFETKPLREIGRYWASDIYKILKGELTPENFFDREPIDEKGSGYIVSGIIAEDGLKKILDDMGADYQGQVKKEMKLSDEISLVIKPDFVFKDFILEVKCPGRVPDDIPPWYQCQLEAYHRGFYLPVYLGIITHHPFYVKQMYYCPSKARWNKIVNIISEFHQKLKGRQKTITNSLY